MHEVERFWYVAYEALKAMGIKPPYTKLTKRINMKLAARNEAGARNLAAKIGLPKRYAIPCTDRQRPSRRQRKILAPLQ